MIRVRKVAHTGRVDEKHVVYRRQNKKKRDGRDLYTRGMHRSS